MNLPILATALAKSIAPKTYIRGGGAKDWIKTVTSSIRRWPRGPKGVIPVRPPASIPLAAPAPAPPGRRGEALGKARPGPLPPLAAWAEVGPPGAPALQHPPRRLHDRPVEVIVSDRAVVIHRRYEQLAAKRWAFYEGRYRHGRLLGQSRVPALENAHYQSTLSTKTWMIPPQVSPTPKASSSEIPYVSSLGRPLSMASIASSKTAGSPHPPLTEPATCPSSETAIEVPGPSGPDRSTLTTLASATIGRAGEQEGRHRS